MAALMLGISVVSTGCMGSWKITKSLYSWNTKATGNKYVNNILFWVLHVIPVYPICIAADYFIFNLVEFWTGSNPLSMKPGDKEKQIVIGKDGNKYEITATQNRFDILSLSGNKAGGKQSLFFDPKDKSWNMEKNNIVTKLVCVHEDLNTAEIFAADGSVKLVDLSLLNVQGLVMR